jgi:hypothetical protein
MTCVYSTVLYLVGTIVETVRGKVEATMTFYNLPVADVPVAKHADGTRRSVVISFTIRLPVVRIDPGGVSARDF